MSKIRSNILNRLYTKRTTVDEFDFNGMVLNYGIHDVIDQTDIWNINKLVTAARYSDMPKNMKFGYIDEILAKHNYFTRITTGTNRIVYKCNYDDRVILKVAMEDIGMRDSPSEAFIQNVLKPRVPKVFDVTPCGTIGLFERVDPILSRYQFSNYAEEIFNIIVAIGQAGYIMEDIGTDFFKNWGIRDGFGPVLLDFPYVYQTSIEKLKCTKVLPNGHPCPGFIDYDAGFNTLVCEYCHQRYPARSLAINNGAILYNENEEAVHTMIESFKVSVFKDGKEYVVNEGDPCIRPTAKKQTIESRVNFTKPENYHSEVITRDEDAKAAEQIMQTEKVEYTSEKVSISDNIEQAHDEPDVQTEKHKDICAEKDIEVSPLDNPKLSAKDRVFIPQTLVIECGDFDFSAHTNPKEQREALIEFCFNKMLTHFETIDPKLSKAIAIEFVDTHYTFDDEFDKEEAETESKPDLNNGPLSKEEQMALAYGFDSEKEMEDNSHRKHRKLAKEEF